MPCLQEKKRRDTAGAYAEENQAASMYASLQFDKDDDDTEFPKPVCAAPSEPYGIWRVHGRA